MFNRTNNFLNEMEKEIARIDDVYFNSSQKQDMVSF